MEKADVERPRSLMSVSGPWHLGVIQISDGQSWGLTGVMQEDEEQPPSDGGEQLWPSWSFIPGLSQQSLCHVASWWPREMSEAR